MTRNIRIFINGFGRIGRTLTRMLLTEDHPVKIVGINDIADLETCAFFPQLTQFIFFHLYSQQKERLRLWLRTVLIPCLPDNKASP